LREIIHARTGRNLDLRVIEGTDGEAWERAQERDNLTVQQSQATVERRVATTTGGGSWQVAATKLQAVVSETKRRSLATSRARLLAKMFPLVLEAEKSAAAGEDSEDYRERQLNRLLDRIANHTELPPTVVALEYLRYSASRKQA
jgi:uncharacterized protein (DUF2267 family)